MSEVNSFVPIYTPTMTDTFHPNGMEDEKSSPIILEKLTNLQSSVTDLQNKVDFCTGEVVALKIDASQSRDIESESGDENRARGNWSSHLEYLLSSLGCVVGLSNLWRFPYLCYKHGGGAFLVPYCVFLVLLGAPMFLLESALGQFTSRGPLGCWQLAPIFKGVGVAMLLVSALVSIYYNMFIGWSVYYLFASFTTDLPWAKCGDWSSTVCVDATSPVTRTLVDCSGSAPNASSKEMCNYMNGTATGMMNNMLGNATFGNVTLGDEIYVASRSSAEEYLERVVFGLVSTSTLDDVGMLRWEMVLCSLLVWIVVYFSLISGIKSSGKVVYLTATLPYLMLVILLVRGVTLPGYMKGINAYITPNVERLMDPRVWKDAAGQVFFSMWVSWGGLITLASYNRFHNDILRDTIMMTVANCVTSLFAGFVVYAYLGHMSEQLGVGIEDVAKQAVTLVFVVLPSAVAAMPTPTVWAVFLFITLIALGLDNQLVLVETVVTSVCDQFPNSRPYRSLTTLVHCLALFLLGLTLCTNSGALWFELMDHYMAGWSVLIIAVVECVAVCYVYGARRFALDIQVMLGRGVCGCCSWTVCRLWWTFAWCLVAPVIILLLLGMMLWDYKELVFENTDFPSWAAALGWLMTLCVVAAIVFGALIVCVCTKGSCAEKTEALFRPSRQWGPALIQHRKLVMHSDIVVDPWSNPKQGPTHNGVMLISKTDKYNPTQGVTNPIYDHAASSYMSAEDPSIFIIPEINSPSQKPTSANNAPNETSTPRLS